MALWQSKQTTVTPQLDPVVERERKMRAEACLDEVRAACQKHNCQIAGQFHVVGSQFSTGYIVIAN